MMEASRNRKMVVFDMDNTLLTERFIEKCAETFNFRQALTLLRNIDRDPVSLTNRVARFMKDRSLTELLDVAAEIKLVNDTTEVVQELKRRGYVIGIISDSYEVITHFIATRIEADFSLANELLFINEISTGHVRIPPYFYHSHASTCQHLVCKTNALRHICKAYDMDPADCIVVGDSDSDACMVSHAGLGISFCSTSELLNKAAHRHISKMSFSELLELAV
jgi:HAD superfamily phosphoserine phosphatase-like hydrolase